MKKSKPQLDFTCNQEKPPVSGNSCLIEPLSKEPNKRPPPENKPLVYYQGCHLLSTNRCSGLITEHNPASNPLMDGGDLSASYAGIIAAQTFCLVGFNALSMRWNSCLTALVWIRT